MSGTSLTSSLVTLARVASRRTPGLGEGGTIPRIERMRGSAPVPADWLADYRRIIGDVDTGVLPPCTPQVLAVSLHTSILGDSGFPLPALGMVHVENRMEEHRPIPNNAPIALRAS